MVYFALNVWLMSCKYWDIIVSLTKKYTHQSCYQTHTHTLIHTQRKKLKAQLYTPDKVNNVFKSLKGSRKCGSLDGSIVVVDDLVGGRVGRSIAGG